MAFITKYSEEHKSIRKILKKNWGILTQDPYLKKELADSPKVIFRKNRTLQNILAASCPKRKRKNTTQNLIPSFPLGAYKCRKNICKCCHI
ncbi:hypothetical protein GDO78_006685 [Eleutherodactylus coqui]|uniref:Uncharacterized protein n=1 Tax=Eleutherodactylus coqui TaxID=57060 RepID=A0A8J6KB45_ELECQ|nr:hypothetical protein GDO78_006685 [Eleutherodactylus coqui]